MELKEYQEAALGAFGRWLEVLGEERRRTDAAAALEGRGLMLIFSGGGGGGGGQNYPRRAWERLAGSGGVAEGAGEYVDRTDDAGRRCRISVSRCRRAGQDAAGGGGVAGSDRQRVLVCG